MVTTTPAPRIGDLVWEPDAPPLRSRAVIVAPHPDDEVLGFAGIMRWMTDRAIPFVVVAVTDGEASHAHSSIVEAEWLRTTRAAERGAALHALRLYDVAIVRLGLPDARVAAHEHDVFGALLELISAATTIVAPLTDDGHPDHDAVGRAALRAAGRIGAGCWQVPIWANSRRIEASYQLHLGGFVECKRAAVSSFVSQITPLGDAPEDGPVLRTEDLAFLVRGEERVVSAW